MTLIQRIQRGTAAALMIASLGACAGNSLGSILGGVLGGAIQQSNGQTVGVNYDNQTQVVYQNQNYPPTSLENGDQVTARIQANGNSYYTDYVQVDRSVRGTSTGTSSNLQTLQGTVRQIDRANGLFTVDINNSSTMTVSLPYNLNATDVNRFNSLRPGDFVRFYGTYLSNSRVELRNFF